MEWILKLSPKDITIWALALVMIACSGEENEGINEETQEEEEYVITDSFYADLDNDTTIEQFIQDKDNFFRRRWDGIRYFNCED